MTDVRLGAVDKQAVVPLYHQVYRRLRDNILAGAWRPGELLPSEREICDMFGVSRITAQKAVEQLVGEQLVRRQQGRGSFVAERINVPPMPGNLQALLDNVVAIGAATRGRLIELAAERPPEDVREAMRLGPRELAQRSWHVRFRGDTPLGLFTTWVPMDVARGISGADIERAPMLQLLEERGVQVAWAAQSVGATVADPVTAGHLDIVPGTPLVRLHRLVHDQSDRPVEHLTSLYRGDLYEHRSILRREAGAVPVGWSF